MENFKIPQSCQNIDEIRQEIDKIDNEIIRLFSLRQEFVKEIVSYKTDEEAVIAWERKNHVINQRAKHAGKLGLNPETFKNIFTLLIEENIKKELEILRKDKSKTKV